MNILVTCLFFAALLPFLSKIPVALAMKKAGGYDNNHPRAQASSLTGFGARAWGAHQNSFESLLIFGIAALTALATHHVTHLIESLAIFYIISRAVYHVLYLMDVATLRTLVWSLGYISSMIILGSCIS